MYVCASSNNDQRKVLMLNVFVCNHLAIKNACKGDWGKVIIILIIRTLTDTLTACARYTFSGFLCNLLMGRKQSSHIYAF